MIIDAHAHLFDSLDVFQKNWLTDLREFKKSHLSKEEYEQWEASLDARAETLIRDMDLAGVDKAIAIPSSPSIAYGEELPKNSIWRVNEYVAEAQKKYPERIIGFVRIDPLRKDAIEMLVKAIKDWGLKGVKIHPTTPVTDEIVQPVMTKINELEIPVLFHMGVDPAPFLTVNGNPIILDKLAARYPKMKIIAGHHARGFEDLLTGIIFNARGRIYSDLALWQQDHAYSQWRFIMKMRSLMDRIPHFVMIGSDWPYTKNAPLGYREWFDAVRNLKIPEKVLELGIGIKDFSNEEKKMILGENAKTLLKI